MANSWQTETGTAGQTTISVNIPYLSRSDIYVYIAGTEKPFTWDSDTVVRLQTPLKGGEEVLVMRRTAREKLRILFSEGAAFSRDNLDEQNMQFLYLSQELVEGRSIEGFYGDISMNTFRITHLGTPINDTDAANKLYVDEEVNTVTQRSLRVPEASVPVGPTVAGRRNKLLGFDSTGAPVSATPIEGSATELELQLKDIDGASIVGRARTIAELKTIEPQYDRCVVEVMEYATGSVFGGGRFEYVANNTQAEDGGYIFVGKNGARWRRLEHPMSLNVTHFGAVMDGKTDDMPAVKRMHYASLAYSGPTYNRGIVIPAGVIALSTFNLGTSEIGAFHLKGPDVNYGAIPQLTIVPVSATETTPMFQMVARRAEISGIRYNGKGTVQPFFKNDVTRGSYLNVRAFVATDCGGRIFQVVDTIDTLLEQVYGYRNSKAFLWVTWSNLNPGAWDHPTAIEIRNANFTGCKGEHVISAIRAGQSLMTNVWFSSNEYTMDISQGGWTLNNLIIEGSTNPVWAQYAKVTKLDVRIAQGATWDDTKSGYTKDMDLLNGGSGNIPSWVTNAYDQGNNDLNHAGSKFDNGVEMGFQHSNSRTLINNDSQEKWFELGYMAMGRLGETTHLEFLGSQGWDSAAGNMGVPGATGFGGGVSHIFIEQKAAGVSTSTTPMISWYNEGNGPIRAVKMVKGWERITVYVKVAQYARLATPFIRSTGVPRANSGSPYYIRWTGTEMTEAAVNALPNIVTGSRRWSINGSGYDAYGLGMDLDSGRVVMKSPLTSSAAAELLPVTMNEVTKYVPIQPNAQSLRVQRYTKATLPRADHNPFSIVLCTDSGAGSGAVTQMQLLFSDGEKWCAMAVAGTAGIGS